MAESPAVLEARERLIELVPKAVATLADLMTNSEQDNVRLGASREVLDRGGLPAKSTHTVEIEVGLDAEIEQLLRGIKRQQVKNTSGDDSLDNIEDAIVIEDQPQLLGEQVVTEREEERAASLNLEVQNEPTEEGPAWWQQNPSEEPPL